MKKRKPKKQEVPTEALGNNAAKSMTCLGWLGWRYVVLGCVIGVPTI